MPQDSYPDFLSAILGDSSRLNEEVARIVAPVLGSETLDSILGTRRKQLLDLYDDAPYTSRMPFGAATEPEVAKFQAEVAELRREIVAKAEAIRTHAADAERKEQEVSALRQAIAALEERQKLSPPEPSASQCPVQTARRCGLPHSLRERRTV
jgi:hypothetical protein